MHWIDLIKGTCSLKATSADATCFPNDHSEQDCGYYKRLEKHLSINRMIYLMQYGTVYFQNLSERQDDYF